MDKSSTGTPWRSLAEVLAGHRNRHPAKIAIVDVEREQHISFAELAGVVDGIALQLKKFGVSERVRVALLIDDGIETVLMWLALWRLGAIVCPFDTSQLGAVATQVAFNALNPALVLYGASIMAADLPAGIRASARYGRWGSCSKPSQQAETIHLSALPSNTTLAMPNTKPDDIAAACCTSGSAGAAKIVLHDHASYWLNGLDSAYLLELSESDRILEYRSLSWYSPQILSLMPFLQSGATLHLARQFSRSRFPAWIANHKITISAGVPTVLNMLLNGPIEELRACASSLRLMTCSSAPLSRSTWLRFEQETAIAVLNMYGSTEAGWICGNRLCNRKIGTVGLPVPYTAFDVVDFEGQSCPAGMAGQVVLEGPKLAAGILEIDGSIRAVRGRRLYSRDLAQRDEDGFVQLLGRMDDLVIRGGIKVAPSEIEDALLAHGDVVEAAAVGVPDPIYGQDIVCYVVLREDASTKPDMLRAYLATRLPKEKRPANIWSIEALPRSSRGKLRRDALLARWHRVVLRRQ
ncbi:MULTISPECIES: class I adenylate-forming enzyme family protein [Burkholderia cepacia complex]|uniref:class I adenylate-forming enzyme family protein n=1 Tax=Burkholderia cepacia complex TaxID=87882 RepID=UPI0009B56C06|nr:MULTISPECIES: class I adenylate-forming enzyme family protein [Burkholderia cepacia complex]